MNDLAAASAASLPSLPDLPNEAAAAASYVRVAGIFKTFPLGKKGSVRALDAIGFDMAQRELVAVVGPSGVVANVIGEEGGAPLDTRSLHRSPACRRSARRCRRGNG